MENTFKGANTEFPNRGIHFMLNELVKFRKQLTVRDEFKSLSGWNNALNHYMVKELENLADTLETITYNPDEDTQEELEEKAADTSRNLSEDFSPNHLASDNVMMPPEKQRQVVWDLSGNDPDLPQMNPDNCPNDHGRMFIHGLDNLFVQLTRLDSRHHAQFVTKYESVMIRNLLRELYALTQRKGGEENKSDIPTGTLPSDDSETFQSEGGGNNN